MKCSIECRTIPGYVKAEQIGSIQLMWLRAPKKASTFEGVVTFVFKRLLDCLIKNITMVGTKVYKKCSPNGRVYLYMGQREYISCEGNLDDIKGIAFMPEIQDIQGKFN